jgi:2-hydroxychromene-2-carboxylate isomerase
MRIGRLAEAAGVKVNWRPFSVRALMIEQGNMIRNQPQKMAYAWRDIARRAANEITTNWESYLGGRVYIQQLPALYQRLLLR